MYVPGLDPSLILHLVITIASYAGLVVAMLVVCVDDVVEQEVAL